MNTKVLVYCLLIIFSLSILSISINTVVQAQELTQDGDSCISYSIDSDRNTISISCTQPTTLTDIDNAIQNPDLLKKEANNTWILDSRIVGRERRDFGN